ncbi:alkanesulfonate monooxygenase SsuD/methylene tetrahydromethanopterin reductase-like flavin-dependent oxidoreductase (luciferase family) [Kribbella amoyensis]|uniref:Alkanesulfonate monooxygenase SsuD/methylene tetrahydromethanopterin reductase-like flavin-dependent oxidoreductase (Luciferase family) n=1 Tax=Kribbella amoyensis TaxID=996641 RepID=A0A561BK33_9ACTN|nr:LLM class flavin-dependent oxidoreductase [Kribbella amoyensis]TWD79237.1 alkanesulfonate monooxygenase SsuD/methylene tetrahydromethanopterin reductase-like flavin-dependent oxidoreductase (luciferase family) [Kribbella amoyensis]
MDELNLPAPCLVVLVGPGASGKSTWAAERFAPELVVSSDRLRALVGAGEDDLGASTDAFRLLEEVVRLRIGRGLTTVIDTLGLDRDRRLGWLGLAREHGIPCVAVAFDTPADECRRRNRERVKRIPAEALTAQLRTWTTVKKELPTEGFDDVLRPAAIRVVPQAFVQAEDAARRQVEAPAGLRFGLQLSSYTHKAGRKTTGEWVRRIGAKAEAAGFDAIYVMDHFRQIPQVGRAWEDFLESWTTLAYLAACTDRVRLGTLVTGITYRNVAHLAKIAATLDVLSGGRAVCGVGLSWFEAEHKAYGWDFPSVADRYALLADALRLLPAMWGPGNKPFHGKVLDVPDTTCYPRPLQDRIPLLVGGSGPRTLRLAARYADAANVFGDVGQVRERAEYLRAHRGDREPIEVTHLSTTLIGTDHQQVDALVNRLRPRNQDPAKYAAAVKAGTVQDQVGRFRRLAEAGAGEVMISLPGLDDDLTPLDTAAEVISAFR